MTAASTTHKRAFASHIPKWQRFQTSVALGSVKTSEVASNIYQRQYSHVYANRLSELKPRCWENVGATEAKRCERVLDLQEDELSVVVGTIIKESTDDKDPLVQGSQCRPNDVLVLEDESGRVNLKTDQVHAYTTGAVMAVEGTVKAGGVLHVDKVYPPAPPPKLDQDSEASLNPSSNGLAPHVLLLSGLACGNPASSSLQRDMLLAYLQGYLSPEASKVCHVIIAGGTAGPTLEAAKEMDYFLVQLLSCGFTVDILPGKDDPTTATWPQRPLHSSLLQQADAYANNLFKTPNPYASLLGNKYIVATDGTNVADLAKHLLVSNNSAMPSELQALQTTLDWGHLCPTGPDSVPTTPHAERDPMILPNMPDLYIAGNCHKFDTSTSTSGQTRLVCVPRFGETGQAVLVNLKNLECEVLKFDDSNNDTN